MTVARTPTSIPGIWKSLTLATTTLFTAATLLTNTRPNTDYGITYLSMICAEQSWLPQYATADMEHRSGPEP